MDVLSEAIEIDVGDRRPDQRRRDWNDILAAYFYPLDCTLPDDFAHGRFQATDIAGIRIGRLESDAMIVTRDRRHLGLGAADFYFMPMPVGGQLALDQHGRRAVAGPDAISFVSTADPYSYDQPGAGISYTLRIPGTALRDRLPDADDFTATSLRGADSAMVRVFLAFARSLCENSASMTAENGAVLTEQLLDLLALVMDGADCASGETAVAAAHRRRVIRHIERHFRDPEISVRRIAATVGLSERYLQKLFADRDQTISSMVRSRRIAEARRLLSVRREMVSAVAYKVGFTDPAHFSRVFRRETGMTPQACVRGPAGSGTAV